jgi:hypothetical protein
MATSGTFIFNPDLAELVDEALERCRIDPAKITSRHILSARRSMRFMCSEWATQDYHDFRIVRDSFTLVQSQATYTGGVDFDVTDNNLIDILDVSLTRSSVDTPVEFTSRDAYDDIPDKTTEGRPDRVFVDKHGVPDMESALYQKAQMAFRNGTNASRERRDVRLMPVSTKRRRFR